VAALLSRIGGPLGFLTAAFFWLVSLPIFLALLASLSGHPPLQSIFSQEFLETNSESS